MKRQLVGLIVLLTFFAGLITIICVNSKYIFRTEPYYSETEVEQMCKDAYQQSIKDNSDTALYDKMSELTLKNLELINKNEILSTENESLRSDNLLKEKNISDNETVIEKLNSQILKFEENKSANETLIAELREQINDLDKQNKLLAYEISENETLIAENNKTIMQLQNSIAYYEEYIQGLETEDEVFAIFVVENEIFNIQKLNKNGLAYLETEPTFAENVTFNGWAVNNEIVNLTSYTLSCNTTFVADLTYSHEVNFIVDDEVYNSQTIVENNFVTIPEVPTKDGYVFDGWSLNKVDLIDNIENQPVIKNLTYYAVFTKVFNVSFVIDNETVSTQQIRLGSTSQSIDFNSNKYNVFNGWTLNGLVVDVENYPVYEDLTFIADITYYYDAIFMVDDSIYNSQLIVKNGFVNLPDEPTKTNELFIGWSINGTDIVTDINSIAVTKNISYIALFETIIASENIVYNVSDIVGSISMSASRTVIKMNKGWELDSSSFKLLTNSKNYIRFNASTIYINNDFTNYSVSTLTFSNGSPVTGSQVYGTSYVNSKGEIIYSVPVGGRNSISIVSVSPNQYSLVSYSYYYGVPDGSDLTNSISSMTNCFTTKPYTESNDNLVDLPIPNENILGWAIYIEDPYFDRTDMSDISSTDLLYIGDAGSTVDLSDFRNYYNIKLFAVYKV